MAKRDFKISRNKLGKSRRKILFLTIFAIILVVVVVLGYLLAKDFSQKTKINVLQQAVLYSSQVSSAKISQSEIDSYKVPSNYPRMIKIPSIDVDARMLPLGLLAPVNGSQQLDVPKNINDTGWCDCSINPIAKNACSQKKLPNDGNTSTANLVDGHSCLGYKVSCVFDNLSKLSSGIRSKSNSGMEKI